jgi:hypothetical protein
MKKLPQHIQFTHWLFILILAFLFLVLFCENTLAGHVDTLDLQLQWVYPLQTKDMKLVDFNHDGINEILVGFNSDSARVGILDVVSQSMVWQSPAFNGTIYTVAAGDRNNDGVLDIVCGGDRSGGFNGYIEVLDGPSFDSTHSLLNLDYWVSAVALYSPATDTGCRLLVGTGGWSDWNCDPGPYSFGFINYGNLFLFNCSSLTPACTTTLGVIGAIRVFDIDGDDIDDVICGHTPNYFCHTGTSFTESGYCKITVSFSESTETVVTLQEPACYLMSHADFDEMEIGDIDGDASPEVVISYHTHCYAGPNIPRLLSFDASTWEPEWSIERDSSEITGLAICHLLNGPSASVCVAYQNGIIRIKDGTVGTDLATSRQLPRINHFVMGNVDQDGVTEICMASDDSLYVYESPSLTVDVEQTKDDLHPENFFLFQNYPNPFNPETVIRFTIPASSIVTLRIYNILGEHIQTFQKHCKAGTHTFIWDGKNSSGKNVASGVYLYKLSAGSYQDTKKMVLIR